MILKVFNPYLVSPTRFPLKKSSKSRKGLKNGYTTGACAAAAAKAALFALRSQSDPKEVEILLPIGESARFLLHSTRFSSDSAKCSVIKDAGDDPDITHGSEIFAEVAANGQKEIHLIGGEGVGEVTRPGLGLETGAPAINPVPQKMIREAIRSVDAQGGYNVTISVPRGEEMAKKTLNARLGIIGGISILGTRGTVIPYSTSAYKQCVTQAIGVAAASGLDHIVLTTGSRTEKAAQKLIRLPEEGFIQMGDFVGHALAETAKAGMKKVSVVGMMGKISKIASGARQTHARVSKWTSDVLVRLARESGLPEKQLLELREANTARHVLEILPEKYLEAFTKALCQVAAKKCFSMAGKKVEIQCLLLDYEGKTLGAGSKTEGEEH